METGEEREERTQQVEWMDMEATSVDIDAIDTDMHARAGDAELYPGSWSRIMHLSFLFERDTEAEMLSRLWLATENDTDCLQPLKQTHGCSLWSSGNCWRRWCRWFLDTSERVVTVAAVVVFQWLHHVRLWLAVAGFGVGIWRVRLLGCASWKQFSCLQKTFCFCEKLTLLHLVPIDEAPASSSMLRAVCVLCGCVHEWEQQLSEHCGAGVQIDVFEVGLGFQEELGEVFGPPLDGLSSWRRRIPFHVAEWSHLSMIIFSSTLRAYISPVVCFADRVPCRHDSQSGLCSRSVSRLSFSTTSFGSLESSQLSSLYFVPWAKFATHPLAYYITLSAWLYSRTFTTCMNWSIFGSQISVCSFLHPFLCLFYWSSCVRCILFRTKVTNLYFSSNVCSSS